MDRLAGVPRRYDRSEVACIIGHGELNPGEVHTVRTRSRYVLQNMRWSGIRCFGFNGDRGMDMLLAEYLLDWRDLYPNYGIKVIQVLPYAGYNNDWEPEVRKRQEKLQKRCDKVKILKPQPGEDPITACDMHLLDFSCSCLTLCRGTRGVTAEVVKAALAMNMPVKNACSWDLRILARTTQGSIS